MATTTPRRRTYPPSSPPISIPKSQPHTPSQPTRSRALSFIAAIIALAGFIAISSRKRSPKLALLTSDTRSDDEHTITNSRLPVESYVPHDFQERVITCIPTVSRKGVEYISNAVKSFRLATNNSSDIGTLVIYDMNEKPGYSDWLSKIFLHPVTKSMLPNWLKIVTRTTPIRAPRKDTLGDGHDRVVWRSKEADDYAFVLRHCMQSSEAPYISIMQDDVIFTPSFARLAQWAELHIHDHILSGRMRRICSGSLFDLSSNFTDGHELQSSNMVARIYRRESVEAWARYFEANYDEAPVDWLADRRCRSRRGVTVVMQPNGVRHRGGVSSFEGNEREGTLT